jgi:UDP-2-acetamido-3-amino-2,3-dideoxy-glucuronate N-acetyltransferase
MNMLPEVYVHETALCETRQVGKGTRVWAFAHVLEGAKIGEDCNICDHVFVEGDVVVGNRVTLKCGVQLWNGVRLGDDVFIGPNATFSNDRFPRSKVRPEKFDVTIVERGASIGANATILPGVRISQHAMVGAGAVVTRDVPPNAIVVGNPAKIVGYTSQDGLKASSIIDPELQLEGHIGTKELGVGGAQLWQLRSFRDMRGDVVPIELTRDLPFSPTRHFVVFGVPDGRVRGEHAHRECHQFLVALHGKFHLVLSDGQNSTEVIMKSPNYGVYMPPLVWGIQYKFSQDCVLSVYCSHLYDPADYIREFQEFERAVFNQKEGAERKSASSHLQSSP